MEFCTICCNTVNSIAIGPPHMAQFIHMHLYVARLQYGMTEGHLMHTLYTCMCIFSTACPSDPPCDNGGLVGQLLCQ